VFRSFYFQLSFLLQLLIYNLSKCVKLHITISNANDYLDKKKLSKTIETKIHDEKKIRIIHSTLPNT